MEDAKKPTAPVGFRDRADVARAPLWLLALIILSGTMAMHVFVPALPQAAVALSTSPGSMQQTISVYIFGLACAQAIYGPLSDHFGRRPVLLVGLVVFTLAGFAAFFAPDVRHLIAVRFLQALGGGAGLALGRAIARDGVSSQDATRRLALVNLMVSLGPGLAPLFGAALVASAGWRSLFIALGAFGLMNLVLTVLLLPETGTRLGHDAFAILHSYRRLLRSRAFVGYALGGGCATTSMCAFIGSAPFIFVGQLHRPHSEVGAYLALNILGIWLGSLAASRLAGRVSARAMLIRGNILSLIGAVAFLLLVVIGGLSVPGVVVTMMLYTFGAGIASPAALVAAMNVDPPVAGAAAGLYGSLQMTIGAICTSLAAFGTDRALSTALVLVAAGAMAQVSFAIALRVRTVAHADRTD